ncbi:hypothetical protein R6Y95_07605 [Methanoculleus palmolei]|uniref:Uncharacterized protein n=2 Tax=cellular organisms TaxID=131567 RepID=A0ABD8A720_9EURY|nr:hypothetical protein R6Y95_07605 [Methanoculleus palmolei]
MSGIHDLYDLRTWLQAGLDDNRETTGYGAARSPQLKAYLLESNSGSLADFGCPLGRWDTLDRKGWYINRGGTSPYSIFLDKTRSRVWILYSVLGVKESDALVEKWVRENVGLDRCWLSRQQLLHWERSDEWYQKGLGIKYSDGLSPEDDAGYFSLKLWHGASNAIKDFDDVLEVAKERFAIHSARWQKRREGRVVIAAEWYSNGKVTIQKAEDIDEVLLSIITTARTYEEAIEEATDLRDKKMGAFELDFSQGIDLDAFSKVVSSGKGNMNLWLVETETRDNDTFKRFKGVDLHTWDRVSISLGEDFAHLTIPGNGCVNAAPRIAALQGEDNAGRTTITFDGVELFA